MVRTIDVSMMYFNNVNRVPQLDDLRGSIRHTLVQILGEAGGGLFVWGVVEGSLQLEQDRCVIFQIQLEEHTGKADIKKFCAAVGLLKVVGNQKVVVRVISVA